MIDEQPQVELGAVQLRGREGLQPLLQRGASDIERVDRVRLAALAGALASVGCQVRRDPQHALAALDQKPLQRPGEVAAVLKRPDPFVIETTRPPQQRTEPAPADRNGFLAEQLAGCGCDGGDRVRTLVSVRAKHDHDPRPPLDVSGADAWWTRLAGGGATHLSSHARHPRPATSDKQKAVRPSPADSLKESQLAARSGPSPSRRTSPTPRIQTASLDSTREKRARRTALPRLYRSRALNEQCADPPNHR